jgi:hypothetical protein
MEKARIRTGWKNRQRSISKEELANAVSSICWRMSLNAARNLHQQDFVYREDRQRIGVIREYLYFLIHCADRLMYHRLDQGDRSRFMQALAADCNRHYRENSREIGASVEDCRSFLADINSRMEEYSATAFRDCQPGYDMLRVLGSGIQSLMGADQTNKWAIDQVMDIDGPEVFDIFRKSLEKLVRNSEG